MNLKKFRRLLPLTYVPRTCSSILEWCPFLGGDKLDLIVNDHNNRCLNSKTTWLPEQVEELVYGIRVVKYDLSTVDQLRIKDFADISIILIDLEAVGGNTAVLDQVKARMSRTKRYYLPQITNKPGVSSLLGYFGYLALCPSDPVIMKDQREFVGWLNYRFNETPHIAIQTLTASMIAPAGGRAARKPYFETLSKLAGEIEDTALMRSLSLEDTEKFAKNVAARESALSRVKEMARKASGLNVSLEAISGLFEMPAEPGSLNLTPNKFITVWLDRPKDMLTEDQLTIVDALDIKQEKVSTVHVDLPNVRSSIGKLGKTVRTSKFALDLPLQLKENVRTKLDALVPSIKPGKKL
jgi:hypothetical protein